MNKSFIKFISTIFPRLVVNFAYQQLTNPQIKKLREHELKVLDTSKKEFFTFHQFDIQTYTWEGGNDKVLLIHGWEGQAGNFAELIEKLHSQNFTIYAFDAPSHGFSSKGKTSLYEFTELVGILIKKFEAKILISHSFGGVATTFALHNHQEISIEKYVLLTTPDKFIERIDDVVAQIGITKTVKNLLIERLEKETNLKVNDMNVSDFVKSIHVNKSLIIHDKNDAIVPIKRAKNVHQHWSNCEFLEIEGTGHFRILRTEFVLEKVLDFLKN
jgi:pimeloyl-ACP methyl ester carboxylesterase